MGHGDTALTRPGSRGRTPDGWSSWDGFISNIHGYLRTMLEALEPDEVIEHLVAVLRKDVRQREFDAVEERLRTLQLQQRYHAEMVEALDSEIERCEEYISQYE